MQPIMRFYNAIIAVYRDRISISMPALLLFLATFGLAGAANAAPLTYVASAKGVNTVTLPSHQAGDVLIAWAVRDGSNTIPGVPAGWTGIQSGATNSLSYALAWKTATSSNEQVGTFSNATSLIVSQYRPGDGYTISFGANSTKSSNQAGSTATYNPLALQNTDGSSWVLGFFATRSSNIGGLSTAPTGMVNRSFDQDATDSVAVHSTPAGVSTWTVKNVTYTGTIAPYRTVVLELKLTPPTGGGLSWQLDEGHYEPRVADMTIVHPRPDNEGGDNSHAQHRNAYPGIPWSTHIDVMGGSYPFRFELTGNVPAGMTIGSELTQVGDVLQASSNYGVISWPNPVAGVYTINVNVYDQEYQRGSSPSAPQPVQFTLTVGTARFVFINPNTGNDTTNTGTFASPFKTTYPLHNGSSSTSTYSGRNVYLLGGTHDLKGMSTNNLNYAMFPGAAPNVFIGYPGQTAVLNLNEGWFVGWGATDFMLKDLAIQHASIWRNDQRFYWATALQLRNSFHNVIFRNYMMGQDTQHDNPALTYFGGLTGQYHNYISFKHCEFTGSMGNISTTYATRNFSFQHNRIHNINTTGNHSDNNNHGLLYFKDGNQNIEVRANSAWENISAYEMYSFAGVGSYNSVNTPYAFHDIRYSFNKVAGFNQAFYGLFEGGDPLPGSVFGFRNSTLDRIADGVAISPPVLNQWTNNVVAEGFHNMQGNFVEGGNVLGTTVLDNQVRLTGAYRTQSLGQVGAEIH